MYSFCAYFSLSLCVYISIDLGIHRFSLKSVDFFSALVASVSNIWYQSQVESSPAFGRHSINILFSDLEKQGRKEEHTSPPLTELDHKFGVSKSVVLCSCDRNRSKGTPHATTEGKSWSQPNKGKMKPRRARNPRPRHGLMWLRAQRQKTNWRQPIWQECSIRRRRIN